ncbi:MAG TPA: response regulator [Candidatus Acidoferrales bacterium]|nr:response regulator [Candidatus Acidoferrales bacterium]
MSTSRTSAPLPEIEQEKRPASVPSVDRRRRRRAKLSAQVCVRAVDSPTPFQEVCKTADVSRDGLLILSSHAGYWKGQPLEVTFPYSADPAAFNQAQRAEVVRVFEYGGGQFGVGLQFATAKRASKSGHGAQNGGAEPEQEKRASVVLAIEPDALMADKLRNLCRRDGYTVVVVPNAQAALDVLKTTVPAVFITAEENSDISGHDLCLIIRKNERLQHVPVVLLTHSAQPTDYAASRELGAVICMTTPYIPDRLLNVIRLVAPPPAQRSAYGARVHKDAIERTI